MAVTSPDNIRTPDSGDQYALVQDLGVLADTTQAAITKRGNLFVGTAAQRTAFTAATNGIHWQDTDGTAARYVRVAGAWVMQGDRAYAGTAAQRTAFTTAPNGSLWSDTDGTKLLYKRDGAAWVSVAPTNVIGRVSSTTAYTSATTILTLSASGLTPASTVLVQVSPIPLYPPSPGGVVADIKFTTDGSAPTSGSANLGTWRAYSGTASGVVSCGGGTIPVTVAASGNLRVSVINSSGGVYGTDGYHMTFVRG